jgi:ribosomal protein S18 acetylase RimI-like enzyme
MNSTLTIRNFEPGDLDAVLALNMHAQDPDADIGASLRFYPALLDVPANFQRTGAFVVGLADHGEIVAMGSVVPVEAGVFEMDYIRVAIPHQRRGHGRAIVRHLEERVATLGGAAIVLTTGADNLRAQRLYESEGYVTTGSTTVYDADGRAWHPVAYRKELRRH